MAMAFACLPHRCFSIGIMCALWLLLFLLPFLPCHNNNVNIVEAFASSKTPMASASHARDTTAVGVGFELIHRHAPKLSISPKSRRDRIKQLIHGDNARHQRHRLGLGRQRRKAFEIIEMPMRSAADTGMGQYFVSFRVGSPRPQKFVLIADTGSDLTWMNCNYNCKDCPHQLMLNRRPHPDPPRRIFRANYSPSFKTIPCSYDFCKFDLADSFSLAQCPTLEAPCLYDYRYADGTRVIGVFANETVSVGLDNGRKIKLHNILVGCSGTGSHNANGSTNFYDADGVMGLGYNKHSFAVKVAEKFGNKFSYCLVDHLSPSNLANYLSFGDININTTNMQYTELLLGYINPFYAVNVSGISVGGAILKIPSQIWNVSGDGGVILDSGSTLTYLAEPAYEAVVDAFKAPLLAKFKAVELNLGPLEYCFEEDRRYEESLVPKLAIHFADGVKFVPPVKSYVIDADLGVKCLGFASTEWPGTSVIGNIMQQNHLWEFDLGGSKLGFAPSSCTTSL